MIRIVTVGYHNPTGLTRLLSSIQAHCETDVEVVVFDNGGSRQCAETWAREHVPSFGLHIVGAGTNLGFGAACNKATRYDTGREWTHVLFINPDAALGSTFGDHQIKDLNSLGGVVGLRVFDDHAKQNRQSSARRFPSVLTSVAGREGALAKLLPRNKWTSQYLGRDLDPNQPARVDWVSGCALYVSKEHWQALNGFDERFFLYVEDVDLGRRCKELSIPVYYSPAIDVVHEPRGSARKSPWRADYYHHVGMWHYYWRWSNPPARALAPVVLPAIALRFVYRRLTANQ